MHAQQNGVHERGALLYSQCGLRNGRATRLFRYAHQYILRAVRLAGGAW